MKHWWVSQGCRQMGGYAACEAHSKLYADVTTQIAVGDVLRGSPFCLRQGQVDVLRVIGVQQLQGRCLSKQVAVGVSRAPGHIVEEHKHHIPPLIDELEAASKNQDPRWWHTPVCCLIPSMCR